MKSTNIVSDDKIREAYNSIVKEGLSLRKVSENTGIERKKLKKLIQSILSEEELIEFNKALGKKNNRSKAGSLNNRHKKEKALEGKDYKEAIVELAQREVKPEWIEEIYNRCQERKQSKVSRDTLAIKLVELLKYFETRNEDIPETSKGYIANEDVIQMVLRNPRMITSDISNNIIPKCSIITQKNEGDIKVANEKIKSNPGIFRKSIKTIKEGR